MNYNNYSINHNNLILLNYEKKKINIPIKQNFVTKKPYLMSKVEA